MNKRILIIILGMILLIGSGVSLRGNLFELDTDAQQGYDDWNVSRNFSVYNNSFGDYCADFYVNGEKPFYLCENTLNDLEAKINQMGLRGREEYIKAQTGEQREEIGNFTRTTR